MYETSIVTLLTTRQLSELANTTVILLDCEDTFTLGKTPDPVSKDSLMLSYFANE